MSTEYRSQMDGGRRPDFKRRLFCIEYPGRVNDSNRMLQTLGGLDTLGIVYGTRNRRVELRFRPDDVYCKPACGEKHATVGLLLKVKVKKKARDMTMPCSSRDSEKLQSVTFVTSLVGIVDTVYRFDNLCDFQYLPMDLVPQADAGQTLHQEDIYERLLPNTLPTVPWLHQDDVPYFLVPPVFSRFDTVHFYSAQKMNRTLQVRTKTPAVTAKPRPREPNTIGRTRKRRQGYAIFVNFSDPQIPTRPNPEALKALRIKFLSEQHYNTIQKMFEERPVWSKNGLLHHSSFNRDQLKYLLPTVAYYYVTGPWRVMWCRFGYDPRVEPSARLYQTFDYRVRTVGGLKNKVKAKRSYSNYLLPYKSSPSSRPKVVIINRHAIARAYNEAKSTGASSAAEDRPHENTCVFRPGYIPSTRQMFYQYCDVLVPEIQTMLKKLPATSKSTACDPTFGFLPVGFNSKCREIVNSLVQAELKKQMKAEAQTSSAPTPQPAGWEEDEDDTSSIEEIMDSDFEDSLSNS